MIWSRQPYRITERISTDLCLTLSSLSSPFELEQKDTRRKQHDSHHTQTWCYSVCSKTWGDSIIIHTGYVGGRSSTQQPQTHPPPTEIAGRRQKGDAESLAIAAAHGDERAV